MTRSRPLTDGERDILAERQLDAPVVQFERHTTPQARRSFVLACGHSVSPGERYNRYVWKDADGFGKTTVCNYCYLGYERP